ncbi:MAG TPA: radical SAM protein [Terriglobales bacterium]|nr:radical SAM protein [Terriglobales bacterium]
MHPLPLPLEDEERLALPTLAEREGESRAPKLVGIAKLASEGESIRQGHLVEYFTLPTRALLNRCTSPRVPFTWTINPYRGCEFGCKYCYARYTHEFMEMRDGVDFERKIYVKQQTAWLLRQELKKVKNGEEIALGTATDPYQPAERRYEVTRGILEELALHHGLRLGIVTKSDLVLRDVELLQKIAAHNTLFVNLTITTLNAQLARILEPRAPRPDLRLAAVRELCTAGVNAGVICAPVLPGITDSPAALDALVRATKEAGGKYIYANPLFLKPCSASVFLPFLEQEFPQLVDDYRKRFAAGAFVSKAYSKRISELMASLRRKHGISRPFSSRGEIAYPPPEEEQLKLFA